MLPSGDNGRLKERIHDETEENEPGKENIKKRKRQNNVKNGSRVSSDRELCDLLPSKRLNVEMEEEKMEVENSKISGSGNRANFSSFSNHFNERSPLASSKPTQAKKLVIKNFKAKPKLPDNFKDTTWDRLREAVCAIHNKTSISSSLEDLYKAVANMCSHKMSSLLYSELKAECERHVKSRLSHFTGYPFKISGQDMIKGGKERKKRKQEKKEQTKEGREGESKKGMNEDTRKERRKEGMKENE